MHACAESGPGCVRHATFRKTCGVSGKRGESMGYSGERASSSGVFVGCCGVYLALARAEQKRRSRERRQHGAVVVQIAIEPAGCNFSRPLGKRPSGSG
jgi:hypothetical protein